MNVLVLQSDLIQVLVALNGFRPTVLPKPEWKLDTRVDQRLVQSSPPKEVPGQVRITVPPMEVRILSPSRPTSVAAGPDGM